MPTISAHVSDEFSEAVTAAASNSTEKKVAPWLAEAARQRLEREGMLPGNPNAEVLAAANEVGLSKAVEVLRKAARRLKKEAA